MRSRLIALLCAAVLFLCGCGGGGGSGTELEPEAKSIRYVFRLLALRVRVDLEPGADRAAFDEAVAPYVLAEARLTATYARP